MTLSTPQSVTLSARRVYEMKMPSVNSNAPLVSVVIPTYSRSDMLTRALESVNAQTYPNIEIVVVDDNGKGTNQQLETQARVLAFETRPGVELHYVVREKTEADRLRVTLASMLQRPILLPFLTMMMSFYRAN